MIRRREFLKIGTAAATVSAAALKPAIAREAREFKPGGAGYSPLSGTGREAVATACAQCVSRCPAIGYVEEGRMVKVEGQPASIRTAGKLCARGQASVNLIYDPDRILYPLRRAGKRGEGKWQRISWKEALDDLAGRLKKLRDAGQPEKFMFHHGWISASADRLINEVFLPTYGTGTVVNQTCLGQGARQAAFQLTWGAHEDNWDFANTRFVLNFGANVLEAHTNHVALARILATGIAERRFRIVTFDVRMSNTAAKSNAWIPIKPGTDLAVALAMGNVVMNEGLFRGEGEAFLEFCKVTPRNDATVAEKVEALKAHLAPYTPEWAEPISGVPARTIRDLAIEFATAKPACVLSSRAVSSNYNGVDTERAILLLAAITGNIDNPGGRCRAVVPEWSYPKGPQDRPPTRRLEILNGFDGAVSLPINGVGHQVLKMIKDGRAGRPEVYLWYIYNPVYANGEVGENIDVLKDEALIPFTVAVTPFYDESAALADLILPDATYLERYDFEDGVSPSQVPEYYLRQPLVPPLGEARDFKDVCCELAERLGIPLGFKTGEEFVSKACQMTPEVADKAGGFRGLTKAGVWHDPGAKPAYYGYRREISNEEFKTSFLTEGVIFDEEMGVYWNWKKAGVASEAEARRVGYRRTPGAHKGYEAQLMRERIFIGFRPDRINKTGYFELYSAVLAERGLPPLPTYRPVPEHAEMRAGDLVLTTYKVNVQTLSTTQNCKWLTEIYFDNAARIHPTTAREHGIGDGDRVRIKSKVGEIETTAKWSHSIVPGIVAISTHAGRWEYGRYASKRAPFGVDDAPFDRLKWWPTNGTHPNWVIPNSPEPVSGQQRWGDVVVTLTKA
ncbi:MAG: molybdopterin-dependent oxidoreductase [Proteobacteria bacterium]|nr:molybdopterin-dependent oxidoreductase [Pseudomonadota bacterium]